MLSKKTLEPEVLLALIGGILMVFFVGGISLGLLRHAGVDGFKSDVSGGSVLLGTLSFQGMAIVLGAAVFRFNGLGWREVFGDTGWRRCLVLAVLALVVVAPLMFGLKIVSELVLQSLGWPVDDQLAVKMIMDAKPWVRAYLVLFAMVLAPLGEEFFFRGLLFGTAKRFGWPKLGYVGVSFIFAVIHNNVPTFLPLFVLALALTWLYDETEGLLAPVIAHSLFNTGNLVLLYLTKP